eukprot:SAG22_NODE_1039_length_5888_cov_4.141302_4_plen_181_part_00
MDGRDGLEEGPDDADEGEQGVAGLHSISGQVGRLDAVPIAARAASLRSVVHVRLARHGKAKEQEARDMLSTQHLSAATNMEPFHLWSSTAGIGDLAVAVDARGVISSPYDPGMPEVYWTGTGVQAVRKGRTDFELKFDDRYPMPVHTAPLSRQTCDTSCRRAVLPISAWTAPFSTSWLRG